MKRIVVLVPWVVLWILAVATPPALAEGDATITLGTDPEPPECVPNPGGTATVFWEIEHSTTADHVYYKLEDPTRTVIHEDSTYAGDSGIAITRYWTVAEGLVDGMYWACVEYWSVECGLEACAEVGFIVCEATSAEPDTWGRIKRLFH